MNIFEKLFFKGKKNNLRSIEYIIVGLGNPGRKYENTRHNAGFMAIDHLCRKFSISLDCLKFESLHNVCYIFGKKVILMKPQTYMNLSGEAVGGAMSFYKIPSQKTIILLDDVLFPIGKIRIRKSGSHAGQNGMKDIIRMCGTDDFPRIKIGVGVKPNSSWNLSDWVLSKFEKGEKENLERVMIKIEKALEIMLNEGIERAMNNFN